MAIEIIETVEDNIDDVSPEIVETVETVETLESTVEPKRTRKLSSTVETLKNYASLPKPDSKPRTRKTVETVTRRKSSADLLALVWLGAGIKTKSIDEDIGNILMFQSAIAGDILDKTLSGTWIDKKLLQKLAGVSKNTAVAYLIMSPVLAILVKRSKGQNEIVNSLFKATIDQQTIYISKLKSTKNILFSNPQDLAIAQSKLGLPDNYSDLMLGTLINNSNTDTKDSKVKPQRETTES